MMSNRSRYTAHRPLRSCLPPHIGRARDSDVIERLASAAYHENGGIYFTEEQLKQMPWQSRELIESEAATIYGPRRRGR